MPQISPLRQTRPVCTCTLSSSCTRRCQGSTVMCAHVCLLQATVPIETVIRPFRLYRSEDRTGQPMPAQQRRHRPLSYDSLAGKSTYMLTTLQHQLQRRHCWIPRNHPQPHVKRHNTHHRRVTGASKGRLLIAVITNAGPSNLRSITLATQQASAGVTRLQRSGHPCLPQTIDTKQAQQAREARS